jgi:SAM-dependent methyltransferase
MQISLLTPDKDPMGAAIADYYANGKATKLRVFSSMFDEDEIPVKQLFRNFDEMPEAEREALRISTGKILDVGAGSGCHSLALQEMGKEVKAIDISPLSIETMQKRGVKDVVLQNFFSQQFTGSFDTILLLMNGSGIVGRIANLPIFFQTIKRLLAPGGCVLMDSSDLRYLFEDEDGNLDIDPEDDYYGEVDFRMQYKNIKGDSFDWLYIDFQTLSLHAANNGFKAEMIKEGEHFDYLAKIHRI